MKVHFEKEEKELIRELCYKLNDKIINIDNLKAEIGKIIKDNDFKIYRNRTNDLRYVYIIDYKDIEIGIDLLMIDECRHKVSGVYWNEY